jgi:hypothetical protein
MMHISSRVESTQASVRDRRTFGCGDWEFTPPQPVGGELLIMLRRAFRSLSAKARDFMVTAYFVLKPIGKRSVIELSH